MSKINYRVIIRKEPEGGFTAMVPSLPGCITYGENLDNAVLMVKEAIELYVESLEAHGEEIPNDENTFEYNLSLQDA
ncbi:MAG: type II toxin-antitoxin system HicB family antitoxin [Ignavibacteriae bacterium]|nr:type II toxin-antitoxin system HicB family antitoxin [Ignavibacteriota bacterium]